MKKIQTFLWLLATLSLFSGIDVPFGTNTPPAVNQVAGGQRAAGPLLITELLYDTPGEDAQEEWMEIANFGPDSLSLEAIKISDAHSQGGREGAVRFPAGAVIAPGQALLVAQTAVGFRALYGFNPDYEMVDSDTAVPDMRPYRLWATGGLALNNGGDELLLLDENNQPLDALNYGDSTRFFAPAILGVFGGQSIARIPADCDTDTAADWQPQDPPTPGHLAFEGPCTAPEPPLPAALPPIGTIQGEGDISPRINETVSFRGLVTGFYEDRNAAGITFYTLFVQDPPGSEDGDPATSDGIAVFLGRQRPSVATGDLVRITGQVTEFFGFTEMDDTGLEIVVEDRGLPLPEPISLTPPAGNAAQAAYLEPFEGMRVLIAGEARVVGPTFSGCSFAVVGPDVRARPILRQTAADPIGQIIPILHTSDVDCAGFPQVKTGDGVSGLAGPLIYHFDQFKLVQQEPAGLTVTAVTTPTLPLPPLLGANQFSVATFNLENHFDATDDTGNDAEPKPSPAAIEIKQNKLARQISEVLGCPTLIGVQEVENETLLLRLAHATAPACGFTYQVTHQESADSRGIDVALLSDPRRVQIHGSALQPACTALNTGITDARLDCPTGQQPLFSRPPLQVDLAVDGRDHTLFILHLKSKREGEAETAPRRLGQAAHLAALIDGRLNADPDARLILLGDLNDYEKSEPVQTLAADGRLANVLSAIPPEGRYSFIFGGAAQLLDGILVSPALAEQIAFVAIQHVNADYPDSLAANPGALYRATDHDLPLLVLDLAPAPPAEAAATASPAPPAATAVIAPTPPAAIPVWLVPLALGLLAGTAVLFWRRR